MKRHLVFSLFVAACLLSILWRPEGPLCSPSETQTKASPEQLRHAIRLSADYLIRACGEDGKFVYRVNLNPKVTPSPRYNMLRHAGALYALATYGETHPDERMRQVLDRGARFLKKNIAPIPGKDEMLALWSHPEITGILKPVQAKLGGTGLGLVALLTIEKVNARATPVDYLWKMGRFLLFMQKKEGNFYSKYISAQGGRDDKWTSLYYPGEVALGLALLYEADPSPLWLRGATDAIAYLARIRAGKASVEADHWALLATARLLAICDRNKGAFPRKAFLDHAVQICESMLVKKATHPEGATEHGCFTHDGRTCPTATRLEGLLAALTFLPTEQKALKGRIAVAVREGISFLLRSQVRSGDHAGGIPRAIGLLPVGHSQFKPSFNKRATEIRMDYVQHALSAMIQFASP